MSLLLTEKSSWEKHSDPLPIFNQFFCLFCVLLLSHELFIYFDVRFAGVFSWPAGRHFMSFGVSFAPQKLYSPMYRTGLYLFLLPPLWCRIRKTICKRREHGRRPQRPLPIVLASCAPGLPSARSSAHGGTCAAGAAERGPASWRPHELRRPAGREPPAVLAGGSAGPVSACGSNTAPLMLQVGRGRLSVCLPAWGAARMRALGGGRGEPPDQRCRRLSSVVWAPRPQHPRVFSLCAPRWRELGCYSFGSYIQVFNPL